MEFANIGELRVLAVDGADGIACGWVTWEATILPASISSAVGGVGPNGAGIPSSRYGELIA